MCKNQLYELGNSHRYNYKFLISLQNLYNIVNILTPKMYFWDYIIFLKLIILCIV